MPETKKIEVDSRDLNRLLKAWYDITNILETMVDKADLYQPDFLDSLNAAMDDVKAKRTTVVSDFSDLIA
jgi:hypothetical protein